MGKWSRTLEGGPLKTLLAVGAIAGEKEEEHCAWCIGVRTTNDHFRIQNKGIRRSCRKNANRGRRKTYLGG